MLAIGGRQASRSPLKRQIPNFHQQTKNVMLGEMHIIVKIQPRGEVSQLNLRGCEFCIVNRSKIALYSRTRLVNKLLGYGELVKSCATALQLA
jgi:hypothetical protein